MEYQRSSVILFIVLVVLTLSHLEYTIRSRCNTVSCKCIFQVIGAWKFGRELKSVIPYIKDKYPEPFPRNFPRVRATRPHWLLIDIVASNGLVTSGNKSLPEQIMSHMTSYGVITPRGVCKIIIRSFVEHKRSDTPYFVLTEALWGVFCILRWRTLSVVYRLMWTQPYKFHSMCC